MKIRAALAHVGKADFTLEEVELDEPREDEILVRIMASGLCHTDLASKAAFDFGAPMVLGHEGAGIVEKVGAAITKVVPGDRVAISLRTCGSCPTCSSGHPAYCRDAMALNMSGGRMDGSRSLHWHGKDVASNFLGQSSFASHALTYESNVTKLPDAMAFEAAAPLGCGVQTGLGTVVNALACERGSSLLVTGCGPVGLSAIMGGKIQGCGIIIAVEPHAARRELALEMGATHVIDPIATTDLAAAILAIVPEGIAYAVDTTGRYDTASAVVSAMAVRASFALVGVGPAENALPGTMFGLLSQGQTIMGVVMGDVVPAEFMPRMMEYYLSGVLPLEKMITLYPLSQINQAITDQHDGKCVKVVFQPD